MSQKFISSLMKVAGNEYASIAEEGILGGDVKSWVSGTSLAMNALLSGSLYKGLPGNKILGLAGQKGVGKTYYALEFVKNFLASDPNSFVVYFESENAITLDMLATRGLDTSRIIFMPVATIEEFNTQCLKMLDEYGKTEDRPPMMIVLDSLGNLSTEKEMADVLAGSDKRDMTKQQLVKKTFRTLTMKLGLYHVSMIVTTHVYDAIGSYVPMSVASGGTGLQYAASIILFLTKKKAKDRDDVIGNIITAKLDKSRMTIEGKKVETLLRFDRGLDKFYGLLELAEKFDIFKKVSTRYELPGGMKAFESEIERNPEQYFTKDVLTKIEEACSKEFLYGQTNFFQDTKKENDNAVSNT